VPNNACPVGSRPRFNMSTSDLPCPDGQCTTTVCCIENTCANPEGNGVPFNCASPSWTQRTNFATALCPGAHCTELDCCVPLCGAIPQCNVGYTPRTDSRTIPCLSGTCSSDVCCTRTMCPATYQCSALYMPKPNLARIACATSTCNDKDCCRDQCANIVCPEGSKKNGNQYCNGVPCTNAECCSQQTTCPSNFVCNRNPYDVRKTGTQICLGTTCTYEECCCTGGCNYCGTQFKGTCPVGSKLQMGVNCGLSTCTADICCVGTCVNYPCKGFTPGPDVMNILCNNPKQCTEADCCVQWGE